MGFHKQHSGETSTFYLFPAVLGFLSCYLSDMCTMSGSYKYPLEEGEKVILNHIGKNKRAFGGAFLPQWYIFKTPSNNKPLCYWSEMFLRPGDTKNTQSLVHPDTQKSCNWQCSYISLKLAWWEPAEQTAEGHSPSMFPVPKYGPLPHSLEILALDYTGDETWFSQAFPRSKASWRMSW